MTVPRLLVVTPDYPPAYGGIQVVAERLATGLAGFATNVVTIRASDIRTRDGGAGPSVRRVGSPRARHQVNLARLIFAATTQGLRTRPDIILNMNVASAPSAIALALVSGAPYVQVAHGEELTRRPHLVRAALSRAAAVVAVSDWTAGLVRDRCGSVPVEVIPNGVDLPRDQIGPRAARPTILTVARMDERYKGHDVLLRAMPLVVARVPDVHWIVVGTGALASTYHENVRAFGLEEHVTFTGSVTESMRAELLRQAWVFALVTRLSSIGGGEGFGIAYLEAAAASLPSVASGAGGVPSAVIDGVTGVIVDPYDHVGLAAALTALLGDRDRAAFLGHGARDFAARHTWPGVIERYEALLNQIVERKS